MGAFFLYHKNTKIKEKSVDNLYTNKGFSKPLEIQIGDYYLKLYKKQLIDINNYYKDKENYIFVCGSLFYKGLSYKQSLKVLLEDLIKNNINAKELYGNYAFIFYNDKYKKIKFFIDPSFIKNIYFDKTKKIISSDFLAIIESSASIYTLNKNAIIENIISGHLISPDTYSNEIQKLDKVNILLIEDYFKRIKPIVPKPVIINNINTFSEAVDHANEQIQNYFRKVSNLANEFGANIGLTGGFDSRLLFMHARKYLKKLISNSFWRPNSIEFTNAKALAQTAAIDFISFEKDPFLKPEKSEMLKKNYLFFDGQVRSQNNWDEEFSLPEYSARIAGNHFVGFHGCGGEQYRNSDRLMRKLSLKNFIYYDWMFKQCENPFLDKKLQYEIFKNIKQKILRLVDIPGNKIGLPELKKIQNEIWNTANRATRVNVLNQQQFYFAPFTEYQLSYSAYNYIPYLGKSFKFQLGMMRNTDPKLSAVKTNYGFNILEGETFKFRLFPYVINIIPRSLLYSIFHLIKGTKKKTKLNKKLKLSNPFIYKIGNKLNFTKLNLNNNLGNSLDSFNYLLDQIKLS